MRKILSNLARRLFTRLYPSTKPMLLTGPGSAIKLAKLVRESGYGRPLLVTERFLRDLGLLDDVLASLVTHGCEVTVFDGVSPNPTYNIVDKALSLCASSDCDCVVVIGGGSAIDAGKVIAACHANGLRAKDVVGVRKFTTSPLPLFVAPTTSGTGSEVTNAAVVSDPITHRKGFVIDPRLVPTAAALDPNLLKSLPPHITAATGMDALTHAIEAYTSGQRFEDASKDAEVAIRLLLRHLPAAYEDGENLEAREMVALAAFLAGYAFNKAGLGYVHAISHQISAHYNTPHGLANAILLPVVLRFNETAAAQRLAALERRLGADDTSSQADLAAAFVHRIQTLVDRLGIPGRFEELDPEHHDEIARAALREARSLYAVPREMNLAQCKQLLLTVTAPRALANTAQTPTPHLRTEAAR